MSIIKENLLKIIIFFLCLMSVGIHSQAQDTARLSLSAIIKIVETSYPEVLMYDSKIKSIEAQAEGAKSWMPPVISVGLDRFPYNPSLLKGMAPDNQAGIMFSAEQMIPNSAKLNAKKDYLQSLATVQQNNAEWTKNSLRSNAKIIYYQRYTAEKKLKIVEENENLLNLFISTAEARYAYNQADLSTIYKARAKKEELDNMKAMLLSQIAESNIGLNILMNRDVHTAFSIDTIIIPKNYEEPVITTSDSIFSKRHDISAMESSIQSMQLNKNFMSLANKPDFGVKATHMNMIGMPNQYSIMGMVTIPIAPWSSKMYKSEVKSMGFEIAAMQKEKETMQLMAKRMVEEKLSMLKYEKEQLKNYEKNIVPAYQKNLEINLIEYRQNTGNFFVLIDAWEMSLMKRMEQLSKLQDVLKLEVEYEYETEK